MCKSRPEEGINQDSKAKSIKIAKKCMKTLQTKKKKKTRSTSKIMYTNLEGR